LHRQQTKKDKQNVDFAPLGKICVDAHGSSHGSATATCEQSQPKQEGKDQASDSYNGLPCT